MTLNVPEISETPENGRLPSKEIQDFADEFCLNNDPIDKRETKTKTTEEYIQAGKDNLDAFLRMAGVEKIKKPE